MGKQEILDVMAELGLAIESTFVPFSRSRNKASTERSLNWRVTLYRTNKPLAAPVTAFGPDADGSAIGTPILSTDYGAGIAHCPSYKQGCWPMQRMTVDMKDAIVFETEHGRASNLSRKAILPDPCDVVSSLVLDASAIDHPSFEDWASNLGYDSDSRKAEAVYRACLDVALKLRAGLGEAGLAKLREACQDY